jgi:hypothetical protein
LLNGHLSLREDRLKYCRPVRYSSPGRSIHYNTKIILKQYYWIFFKAL